jgi:hypothetical protein
MFVLASESTLLKAALVDVHADPLPELIFGDVAAIIGAIGSGRGF